MIFTEAAREELCYENLDKDIDNINKWLKINKLTLIENRIKLIEINMNTDKLIKIDNVIIERVNTIKYFRFLIDKCLNFKQYIEYTCKKIGKIN